jgi:hypothetical protein
MVRFGSTIEFFLCARHYPVGLLFDLYADAEQLPWDLEVHFGAFPVQSLIQMPSYDAPMEFFMSMIKEVFVIRLVYF